MVIGSEPFMKHNIPSTERKKYQCLEYHKFVFLLPNISRCVPYIVILANNKLEVYSKVYLCWASSIVNYTIFIYSTFASFYPPIKWNIHQYKKYTVYMSI